MKSTCKQVHCEKHTRVRRSAIFTELSYIRRATLNRPSPLIIHSQRLEVNNPFPKFCFWENWGRLLIPPTDIVIFMFSEIKRLFVTGVVIEIFFARTASRESITRHMRRSFRRRTSTILVVRALSASRKVFLPSPKHDENIPWKSRSLNNQTRNADWKPFLTNHDG